MINNSNDNRHKDKHIHDHRNNRPHPPGPPPGPLSGHPPPPGPPNNQPPGPPPGPAHMQNDKLRARFELDSAYRDFRRGELIVQQIETYLPSNEEASLGREILTIASEIYQSAYRHYQRESFYKAAEFSVAVKDLMRGIDKFYNTAGPYPINPESERYE